VGAGDRGTLVARGYVGPARWIKTPSSLRHQENTLKMSPGVFLGKPDDITTVPPELIEAEMAGLNAVYDGDEDHALMAAGEVAQRIEDLPTARELVDGIMEEAMGVVSGFADHFVVA
jgi:enoyl-[acyl-carrier protein] reductase II